MLEGREKASSCEGKGEDCDCCGCGCEFCCAEKRRERVCSVDCVNVRAADARVRLGGIRCTAFSSGRLSRWRFLVREGKREGVWIGFWGPCKESRVMKFVDERGEERMELVEEISESERLRFSNMLAD